MFFYSMLVRFLFWVDFGSREVGYELSWVGFSLVWVRFGSICFLFGSGSVRCSLVVF